MVTKCSYCQKAIEPGTGKIFVRKDGKAHDLCSSKCERNWLHLGRKPLQLKWTESYRKFRQKKSKQ